MVEGDLRPYERLFVDARHRALTEDVLAWSLVNAAFAMPSAAKQAVNASTFGYLCRPTTCTDRQLWLATSFALLFFYLDDTPATTIEPFVHELDPLETLRAFRAGAIWLDDHRELATCSPTLREDFVGSLQGYLRSIPDELRVDAAAVTSEEHWLLRRRSVFVDTYLAHWLVALDLVVSAAHRDGASKSRSICVDLVILANDLGSLRRDSEAVGTEAELNLAHTYARERGCSTREAVEGLVAHYNRLASDLREIHAALNEDAAGSRYADLVRGIVLGNVEAMKLLAHRYPDTQALLAALDAV